MVKERCFMKLQTREKTKEIIPCVCAERRIMHELNTTDEMFNVKNEGRRGPSDVDRFLEK